MGDALHAVDEEIKRLTTTLIQQQREDGSWHFYTHYHSYRYIWPLLALSHYRRKYDDKHN
ncbi:hypothetical protein [Paenibacillus woosongensis]|uniref:Squalene cyclase C-terminal domain-containing protein n=1 Tax=Paenibacillus woosongensis TaxID=307580 RepID=A0A7X3CNQ2_9BACL|nr:hypothetical protein [Paenibacillus woosongensis]MUG47008.1 hypothetical protein [Paenibacillus woosongensis]